MGPCTVLGRPNTPWFFAGASGPLAWGACGLAPELGLHRQPPPFPGPGDGSEDRQRGPAETRTDRGSPAGATEAAWLHTPSFLS